MYSSGKSETPGVMKQVVQFGCSKIEFSLCYKARKTLGIRVHPDTSVEVLAPLNSIESEILEKVKSKAPWILKQISYFNSFRPLTPPRRYISGETHLYLGRQYRLKVIENQKDDVHFFQGQLVITIANPSPKSIEKQLLAWYKKRAIIIFQEILRTTLPRFTKYNIAPPEVCVKVMKKRWGSCTYTGKITLNTELVKAPKGCIEYVIIHELCHLIHHNHTKVFFDLQEKMMPDWQKWKNLLEKGMV